MSIAGGIICVAKRKTKNGFFPGTCQRESAYAAVDAIVIPMSAVENVMSSEFHNHNTKSRSIRTSTYACNEAPSGMNAKEVDNSRSPGRSETENMRTAG